MYFGDGLDCFYVEILLFVVRLCVVLVSVFYSGSRFGVCLVMMVWWWVMIFLLLCMIGLVSVCLVFIFVYWCVVVRMSGVNWSRVTLVVVVRCLVVVFSVMRKFDVIVVAVW